MEFWAGLPATHGRSIKEGIMSLLLTTPPGQARPRRALRLGAALLAAAILLLLGATAALGAPASIRILDTSPSLGHEVTIAVPGGESFRDDPGRQLARITPAGGAAVETAAWCVDWQRAIDEGIDYPVDLQSAPGAPHLAGPAAQEAAWLIGRADALIAASATPGLEAAAIQVAVWQLTGQASDVPEVTDDVALNARVVQLRALAAGRSPASSLALAAPAGPVSPGAAVTVAVTGTPGAEVSLAVTGGSAALSATGVTLGPGGAAQVLVTPLGAGQVVVSARAQGGLLWRASHLPGAPEPQDMAYVAPLALSATATLAVTAPQPTIGPLAKPRPAALRLVKTAPTSALRGSTIPYTLTVTNTSGRTAREVVLRDRLPEGTVLVRTPARARLSRGVVVWRLGDLAPRASVTVRMRLRTDRALPVVRNVARASAANAATVRAKAVTQLRQLPTRVAPVVVPAVTG
jgi:uncharacterized repeat protein (TIGR01451 family)